MISPRLGVLDSGTVTGVWIQSKCCQRWKHIATGKFCRMYIIGCDESLGLDQGCNWIGERVMEPQQALSLRSLIV